LGNVNRGQSGKESDQKESLEQISQKKPNNGWGEEDMGGIRGVPLSSSRSYKCRAWHRGGKRREQAE